MPGSTILSSDAGFEPIAMNAGPLSHEILLFPYADVE